MSETLKPNMLTRLKQKMTQKIKGKYMIFRGSEENYVRHGAWVLEESIDLFHGKTNPVGHLSVDDLNNMNVDRIPCYKESYSLYNLYQGSWEGRVVLVKKYIRDRMHLAERILREIVVATQMASHNHAHKILGYCLETDHPVVVYEWMPPETLEDRIFVDDENQSKAVLEWKDRLRIAWEISHVVSYLHTAFPRPIIHRELIPSNVFLDQNNAAKLGDFGLSVSIPEGEKFVTEPPVMVFPDYGDTEFRSDPRVAEITDVYSFGMLLLVLLTGKRPIIEEGSFCFGSWVENHIKNDCVNEIVDPAITRNGVTTIEDIQLRASAHLAIRCIIEADYRPTMVEVATELKNMITSPEFIPTATNFQENGLYRIFYGSEEYFTQNSALVHKESISLFNDSVHPIRYFSVHELNNMNVEFDPVFRNCYRGTWEGKAVLVRLSDNSCYYWRDETRNFREIVVATKMVTHNNVHKLLGCCLETKLPVLVYEWAAETLEHRILRKDENHCRLPPLEWKDRLRIAWEISDVVSYLHTAFPKPIIHGSLCSHHIILYQDNTVNLSSIFYSLTKGEDVYSDVYSFGMLFLELLTGKEETFLSTSRGEQCEKRTNLVVWITEKIRLGNISEIVDPTITKNGVATTELSASIELALKCTTGILNSPTMVDIATELNNIISSHDSIPCTSTFQWLQGEGMYMKFRGCKEYHIQNESFIVEESNSLFPGKMKPIRYFSVDELCKMKVEYHRIFRNFYWRGNSNWYRGSWEGNVVLVKLPKRVASDEARMRFLREILVATQMASHSNVQKLIGCCLETEYPVLVYESVAEETLEDWISYKYDYQTKPVLEWKERLRIAWEISQVVSHLHNDFSRPIIHGYLETYNIFLDLDNTVKLSNFSRCTSIPEGQNDDCVRVAQCTDVYSFGILFQELLTGESVQWVYEDFKRIPSSNIVVDPAIAKNGVVTAEMTASIKLALKCTTKVDKRPTMVQVATELKKIIRSSDFPNNGFSLLRGCLTS